MNKSGVVKELEVLREKHQNEMTAIDHARKLARYNNYVYRNQICFLSCCIKCACSIAKYTGKSPNFILMQA